MASEPDLAFASPEELLASDAKGRFLDSLGFDESFLLGLPENEGPPESRELADEVNGSRGEEASLSPGGSSEPAWPAPMASGAVEETSPPLAEGPASDDEASEGDRLHLHCPECEGALLLERRHLGIEGVCVWCHSPIVAAASGRDGSVRVFPILGVKAESPLAEATAAPSPAAPSPAAPASESPAPASPVSAFSDSWSFFTPETRQPDPAPPTPELVDGEDPAPPSAPVAPWGLTPSETQDAEKAPVPSFFEPTSFSAEPGESPFASSSPWGPPPVEEDETEPFTAEPAFSPAATSWQDPEPAKEEPVDEGDPVSSSWPSSWQSEPAQDEAEAFSGSASPSFLEAAPFLDAAPAADPIAESPVGFRPAFGTGSAADRAEDSPRYSFDAAPAVAVLEPSSPLRSEGFAFGAPATPPVQTSEFGFGFLNAKPSASPSLPWGPPLSDEAPESVAAEEADIPPANDPFGFGSLPNAFAERSPAASPFGTAPQESASPPSDEAWAPTVISQPLFKKPKPRVRRGFLVLMVVIVGFACGAALATFVLPVDRYVAEIRSYLEAKLSPAAPEPFPLPAALPEGVGEPASDILNPVQAESTPEEAASDPRLPPRVVPSGEEQPGVPD